MPNYLPAGYSSEEGDSEDDYYYSKAIEDRKKKEPTEEEKLQIKINLLERYSQSGNTVEVLRILDEGFNINSRLRDDWTLLLLAASCGNVDMCSELINRSADVDLDRDGLTPLMAACRCPVMTQTHDAVFKIVKHLIDHSADVHKKDRKRMTAFLYAASNGNIYAIEYLLQYVNKHEEDNQGWTALFWAVSSENVEAVKVLIDAGLHVNKYDIRGFKALDYAKQLGANDIINLLPDPDRRDDEIQNTYYSFEEEIQSGKFLPDVFRMLNGMKCHKLFKVFNREDMSLFKFLTITEKDLRELGITKPYQLNRILGGLHRFHKHSYKRRVVPFVPKEQIYTAENMAISTISALRHVITVHAGVRYLRLNFNDWDKDPHILEQIDRIQKFVIAIEGTVKQLRVAARRWDLEIQPVDLITFNPRKPCPIWIKMLPPVLGLIGLIIYKIR